MAVAIVLEILANEFVQNKVFIRQLRLWVTLVEWHHSWSVRGDAMED